MKSVDVLKYKILVSFFVFVDFSDVKFLSDFVELLVSFNVFIEVVFGNFEFLNYFV